MVRIPPLSIEHAPDDVRRVYAYAISKYGQLPLPLSVSAHHPEVFRAFVGYEASFAAAQRLDGKLKALASIKVAALNGCLFCIDIGSAEVREAGVSEEQLRELPSYSGSKAFSPTEKRVLDYAVGMTRSPVAVPDELFEELRSEFDAEQMIELSAAIAWENYRSRFNHALALEPQGFSDGAFCVVPEAHP